MEALGRLEIANTVADFLELTAKTWLITKLYDSGFGPNQRLEVPVQSLLSEKSFSDASTVVNELLEKLDPPLIIYHGCNEHPASRLLALTSLKEFNPINPTWISWNVVCVDPVTQIKFLKHTEEHTLGVTAVVAHIRQSHPLTSN